MTDKNVIESVSAIKQYVAKNKQNTDRHKANVLLHAYRKDYGPGFLIVFAYVEDEFGKVVIEDLDTIYIGCQNTFTTENSTFSYIGGTLQIKAKDTLYSDISISVT